MSVTSVLLYVFKRATWMRWREWACVWTNVTYGLITVLKIFHLVPRLPNENNYLFKHCFLTMADAAFSQTPVHKQYVVQFAEAVIRIEVWRRYSVLPNVSTLGVIAASLGWQVWLVTFSSMLQARHVSAFLAARRAAPAASAAAASSSGTTTGALTNTATPVPEGTATAAAAVSAVDTTQAAAGLPAAPADTASPAATQPADTASRTVTQPAVPTAPVAAAAAYTGHSFSMLCHTPSTSRNASATSSGASGVGGSGAAPQVAGQATGGGLMWPLDGGLSAPVGAPVVRDSSAVLSPSQMRYMRALRGVARGPSSYVLLAHQRKQAGGVQCASAQLYVSSASPDMLVGNWREKLATAVAEGAPGWQVANVCVRKGSLIVHMDLVYAGASFGGGAADAAALAATAAGSATTATVSAVPDAALTADASGCCSELGGGLSSREALAALPPNVAYSAAPAGTGPAEVLDEYVNGMTAESLLALLGLPPDLPTDEQHPVAVQLGSRVHDLHHHDLDQVLKAPPCPPIGCEVEEEEEEEEAGEEDAGEVAAAAAEVAPAPADAAVGACGAASTRAPLAPEALAAALLSVLSSHLGSLRKALLLAALPPADLHSPAYGDFLARRAAPLHLAYASFMCLTALVFMAVWSSTGVNPITMMLFIAAEVLTVLSLLSTGLNSGAWRRHRCELVYLGVMLRTIQMAACTCGFLPHILKDTDCVSGRWVQKVVLITTLQALCMQLPVRSFFLVRLPSLLVVIYVHVFVCRSRLPLPLATALHLGWEALLFGVSAVVQQRHYAAFLASRQQPGGALSKAVDSGPGGSAAACDKASTANAAADTCAAVAPATEACQAPKPLPDANDSAPTAASVWVLSESQPVEAAAAAAATPPAAAAVTVSGALAGVAAADDDPTDVSLSSPVIAMTPRRAARLQLHFTCTPAVVDELQVVLRHINPASMSSGVHAAHAVRDIAHALATPYAAAAAPAHVPAAFTVELTLVASPADMPGLVHIELWRGRRRVTTQPVLLATVPSVTAAARNVTDGVSMLKACAARVSEAGCAAAACGTWLDDVVSYIKGLRAQGHGAAADQFVEELGGWLAQAAADDRGLVAAAAGDGGAAAPRVANVLYFHGYGSEFMYLKPKRVSGGGGGGPGGESSSLHGEGGRGEAAAAAACAAASCGGSASALVQRGLQCTLRQLLLCQGSMLLAVAVEAGCVQLSSYLTELMVGQMGASVASLLEKARTPVTQLPLLHAAVKSGSVAMVDLVAEWSASCGQKDIWAQEAAVLAVALLEHAAVESVGGASGGGSSLGSTQQLSALSLGGHGGPRRPLQAPSDQTSPFRSFEDDRGLELRCGAHVSASMLTGNLRQVLGSCSMSERSVPQPAATAYASTASPSGASHGSAPGPDGPIRAGTEAAAVAATASTITSILGGDASGGSNGPALFPDLLTADGEEDEGEQPFKIITFCSSMRRHHAAAAHATSSWSASAAGSVRPSQILASGDAAATAAPAPAAAAAAGTSRQNAVSCCTEDRRRSVDSVVDGGVLVLTPLHLSLALGDEGRLASHILGTYPEAYELWRMSQPHPDMDSLAGGLSTSDNNSPIPSTFTADGTANTSVANTAAVAAATAAAASPSPPAALNDRSPPTAAPSKVTAAYASLPGLGRGGAVARHAAAACGMLQGGQGHHGCGYDGFDSLEVASVQSMSLSEVAFLEGFRWVDDEAAARRGGFKVTRM